MKKNNSNIKLQIACIIFAFFAWIYVMSDLDPVDTRDMSSVDVNITNITELNGNNLVLSPNQSLKANVKIKGRRSLIAKKIKDGINLQTTIENAKIGENKVKIVPSMENTDISYEITPSFLDLNLEENKIVTENININIIGQLENSYRIDNIKLSKAKVKVSGAKSLIEKLYKVQIDLDISEKTQDFSTWSKLKFLDISGNEIVDLYVDTPEVMASVKINKEKIVPIVLNLVRDDDKKNVTTVIEPSEIKIYGTPASIDAITQLSTEKVNTSQLSTTPIEAKLLFVNGVSGVKNTVKVSIK